MVSFVGAADGSTRALHGEGGSEGGGAVFEVDEVGSAVAVEVGPVVDAVSVTGGGVVGLGPVDAVGTELDAVAGGGQRGSPRGGGVLQIDEVEFVVAVDIDEEKLVDTAVTVDPQCRDRPHGVCGERCPCAQQQVPG